MQITQLVTYGTISAALAWTNGHIVWRGWPDFLMLVGFCLFLLWLLSGARGRHNPAHHEGADQGIAFRLGKSLNRIWRSKGV